jgi:hypothetical protein
MPDFYTQTELASIWHCNSRHIGHLRMYGLLPAIKFGRYYIYRKQDVDTFWQRYSGCDLSNLTQIKAHQKRVHPSMDSTHR